MLVAKKCKIIAKTILLIVLTKNYEQLIYVIFKAGAK